VATLYPERRIYKVSRMPMTEVAIDRGSDRDLYVAFGEPVSSTAWSVRLPSRSPWSTGSGWAAC